MDEPVYSENIHINTDYKLRDGAKIIIGDKDSTTYRLKLQAVDFKNKTVLMKSDLEDNPIWVDESDILEDV